MPRFHHLGMKLAVNLGYLESYLVSMLTLDSQNLKKKSFLKLLFFAAM